MQQKYVCVWISCGSQVMSCLDLYGLFLHCQCNSWILKIVLPWTVSCCFSVFVMFRFELMQKGHCSSRLIWPLWIVTSIHVLMFLGSMTSWHSSDDLISQGAHCSVTEVSELLLRPKMKKCAAAEALLLLHICAPLRAGFGTPRWASSFRCKLALAWEKWCSSCDDCVALVSSPKNEKRTLDRYSRDSWKSSPILLSFGAKFKIDIMIS